MKISVAIATYNGEKYIIEELNSILNQTYQVDEVIINDDVSSDYTYDLVSRFIEEHQLTHWKIYRNSINLGHSRNFFDAISKTTGDIIFIADQDDLWPKNKVELMVERFLKNPNLKAVATEFEFIDANSNKMDAPKGVPNSICKLDGSIQKVKPLDNVISSYIRGCTTAVKRDVVEYIIKDKLYEMCSNNLLGHDWLIWMLASLFGDAEILALPLLKYRFHDTNTSLEAVRRKTLLGSIQKRINGLQKSIEVHSYLRKKKDNFINYSENLDIYISNAIQFETKRLKVLKTGNIFTYFSLLFKLNYYKRYYRDFKRGVKVYIADMLYYLNRKKT